MKTKATIYVSPDDIIRAIVVNGITYDPLDFIEQFTGEEFEFEKKEVEQYL